MTSRDHLKVAGACRALLRVGTPEAIPTTAPDRDAGHPPGDEPWTAQTGGVGPSA